MEERQEKELMFNIKHVLGTVLSSFANSRQWNNRSSFHFKDVEAEAQKEGFPKVTNLGILCAQICVGFFSSGIPLSLSNNPLEKKLRLREVKQPAQGYPGL